MSLFSSPLPTIPYLTLKFSEMYYYIISFINHYDKYCQPPHKFVELHTFIFSESWQEPFKDFFDSDASTLVLERCNELLRYLGSTRLCKCMALAQPHEHLINARWESTYQHRYFWRLLVCCLLCQNLTLNPNSCLGLPNCGILLSSALPILGAEILLMGGSPPKWSLLLLVNWYGDEFLDIWAKDG